MEIMMWNRTKEQEAQLLINEKLKDLSVLDIVRYIRDNLKPKLYRD